jgi:hypothetical protein
MRQRLNWTIASQIPNQRRVIQLGKITLAVGVLWAFKRLVNGLGLDVLRIDSLFIALVLATLILLSLLLNGVLNDYKESEKLPGEAATILEMLSLEILAIPAHNPQAQIKQQQEAVTALAEALLNWLLSKISTSQLHMVYQACFKQTVAATVLLQASPPLQARLMQQLERILQIINRIESIRSTGFVTSVYWLAYLGTGLTCVGLVFTRIDPPLEAGLFLFVVSFILLFLIRLIGDLDNPFGFSDADSAEDVNIDILMMTIQRLQQAPHPLES